MICPLESRPTIARNEVEWLIVASKLSLTHPQGGGTQGTEGGANLAFQAAKWKMKAWLMSKTMSIELEGEPLKTNLLRLRQILSQAMVGKREKA